MPQVKILRNFTGSQHGHDLVNFTKGEVVEMTDRLAEITINDGSAKLIDADDSGDESDKGDAPENDESQEETGKGKKAKSPKSTASKGDAPENK